MSSDHIKKKESTIFYRGREDFCSTTPGLARQRKPLLGLVDWEQRECSSSAHQQHAGHGKKKCTAGHPEDGRLKSSKGTCVRCPMMQLALSLLILCLILLIFAISSSHGGLLPSSTRSITAKQWEQTEQHRSSEVERRESLPTPSTSGAYRGH